MIYLVGLIKHLAAFKDLVFEPLSAGNLVADRVAEADLAQDVGVDSSRERLAGARVGQGQHVEVRPQTAFLTNLAAAKERLQRHRAAEGQRQARIASGIHAEVHDFADEAGDTQKPFGDRVFLFEFPFAGLWSDFAQYGAEEFGEIHIRSWRWLLSKSVPPQRRGRRRIIATMFEHGVHRERRIGAVLLKRPGAAGENVEDAFLESGAPAAAFSWPTPVFIVATLGQSPTVALKHGTNVAAMVEIITWPAVGRRRQSHRRYRVGHTLRQSPSRFQEQFALAGRQHGQTGEIPLHQLISLRRSAEKQPAFTAGFDECQKHAPGAVGVLTRPIAFSGNRHLVGPIDRMSALRQFQISADGRLAAVDDVSAAGRGPLDHQPSQ